MSFEIRSNSAPSFSLTTLTALLLQIDSWIDRAERGVESYRIGETGGYRRGSADMASHECGPTNTFISLSLLHSEHPTKTAVRIQFPNPDRFGLSQFLKCWDTDNTFKTLIGKSRINSAHGQEWNVYTASYALKAIATLSQWLAIFTGKDTTTPLSLLQKNYPALSAETQNQQSLIVSNVFKQSSGHLEGPLPHPYLTFHAIDSLKSNGVLSLLKECMGDEPYYLFIEDQVRACGEIIGSYVGSRSTPHDLMRLVFHASTIALVAGDRAHQFNALLQEVVDIVCEGLDVFDSSALQGSIPTNEGFPIRVTAFEVMTRLMKLCHVEGEINAAQQRKDERFAAFHKFFDRAVTYAQHMTSDLESPTFTWTFERKSSRPAGESSTTAFALDFFRSYRDYLKEEAREIVLCDRNALFPAQLKDTGVPDWTRDLLAWEGRTSGGVRSDLKDKVNEQFILPLTEIGSFTVRKKLPAARDDNVSLIMYGPPGSGKTTIAKSMAAKLDWPLIVFTPGQFLGDGIQMIDTHAQKIFQELMLLERVVILFDECDELFRLRPETTKDREVGSEQISANALVTGAMLPRIQDLHDHGGLIFILATNRITAIDPAIHREGRFDARIPVGFATQNARKEYFGRRLRHILDKMKIMEGDSDSNAEILINRIAADGLTRDLTFHELRRVAIMLKKRWKTMTETDIGVDVEEVNSWRDRNELEEEIKTRNAVWDEDTKKMCRLRLD